MKNNSEKKGTRKFLKTALYMVLSAIVFPVSATAAVMLSIMAKYRRIIPRSFIDVPVQAKRNLHDKSMPEVMSKISGTRPKPRHWRLVSAATRAIANLTPALLEAGKQTAGIVYPYPNAFLPIVIQSIDGTPVCGVIAMQPCEEERPGIVLVHDFMSSKNAYEIEKIALKAYYDWGFHVFAIDLRGSGDTNRLSGAPASWGYRESEDIISSVEYMDSIENVGAVGVCGIGLGASAAIIAGGHDETGSLIRGGIVAVSPYSDAERTINYLSNPGRGPLRHFFSSAVLNTLVRIKTALNGPYPIKNLESYTREISSQYYELGENALYRKSSPVNSIGSLETPCLVIHSRNDGLIPLGEIEELLFHSRRNPNVDSVILPLGGHGNYSAVYPEEFHKMIRVFFVYWTGFNPEPENWIIGANQSDLLDNKDK